MKKITWSLSGFVLLAGFLIFGLPVGVSAAQSFNINSPINSALFTPISGGSGTGVTMGGIYRIYAPTIVFGGGNGTPSVYVNNVLQSLLPYVNGTNYIDFVLGTNWNINDTLSAKILTSTGLESFPVSFTVGSQDPALFGCVITNPPFSPNIEPDIKKVSNGSQLGRCPDNIDKPLTIGTDVIFYGSAFKAFTSTANIVLTTNNNLNIPIKSVSLNSSTNKWEIKVTMPGNLVPGQNNFKFVINGATFSPFIVQIDGTPFSVPNITATPASVFGGDTVTVNFSNVTSATVQDWIGRFLTNQADNNPNIDWLWTNSNPCSTPPRGAQGTTTVSSGSCTFVMPSVAGIYDFRFFPNGTTTSVVKSNTVTVALRPVFTATPTIVLPGDPITVHFENISLMTPASWIARVASTSPNGAYDSASWGFANTGPNCTKFQNNFIAVSGTCIFTAPSTLGVYNFRMFRDLNGLFRIALSNDVTVASSTPSACTPPATGDWTVSSSCTFTGTAKAPASVIVPAGKVLTLSPSSKLLIDFKHFKLLVQHTGGVLIKNTATLRQVQPGD
ncbi:MAG: hypothetical protein ABL899_00615 [Nitrospira sp.]